MQAAALAGTRGRLTLLAVTWQSGVGATARALLSHSRADEALRHGRDAARALGADVAVCTARGEHPAEALALVSFEHDLVVVGAPTASRAQAIAVGRTASTLMHRIRRPALFVRRPQTGSPFLRNIVLATDGSVEAHAAAEVVARLAATHDSRVAIAAPMTPDVRRRHAIAQDAAMIMSATGLEPVFVDEDGPAPKAIAAAAATAEASLIVIGSRRLQGVDALGSVSERVVHGAPCSVLVVRTDA
jgi:nucleotide-binding universal stress UspA family protein